MAYEVLELGRTEDSQLGAVVSTLQLAPPVGHRADDYLEVWIWLTSGTFTASDWNTPTGFTELFVSTSTNQTGMGIYYKKATSSNEPVINITLPVTTTGYAFCRVIRDADPNQYIDTSSFTGLPAPTNPKTLPAITTNYANSLVVNFLNLVAFSYVEAPLSSVPRRRAHYSTAADTAFIDEEVQITPGEVAAETLVTIAQRGSIGRYAIKNAPDGSTPPNSANDPMIYRVKGGAIDGLGNPASLSTRVSMINGKTVDNVVITAASQLSATGDSEGSITRLSIGLTGLVGNYTGWVRPVDPTKKDWSGIFTSTINPSSSLYNRFVNGSLIKYLEDNLGNWVAHLLGAVPVNIESATISTWANLPVVDGAGVIDYSDIAFEGEAVEKFNANTTGTRLYYFSDYAQLGTLTMIGGREDSPINGYYIANMMRFRGTVGKSYSQVLGQDLITHSVQIGDGSTKSYFKNAAESISYPLGLDRYSLQDGEVDYIIYASTKCTIDFRAGVLASSKLNNFTFNPSSSLAADYFWNGGTLKGFDPAFIDGLTVDGYTFDACAKIKGAASAYQGITVTRSVATDAAIQITDGGEVSASTLTRNGETYAIEVNTSADASVTITNNTLNGYTTNEIHLLDTNAANTVTINLSKGEVQPSVVSEGVAFVFNQPATTFTIESDTAATDIRYFADDSQTPLDSATGTSLDYDFTNTDPIDIELVKQGFVPINRQNITPSESTLSFVMDIDEAYNSAHGLVEGTDYTYSRATKVLTLNSDLNAFDVRSALADEIRTDSVFFNTPLLLEAIPGLARIDLKDGASTSTMANWKRAGMERFDVADDVNPTEKWVSVLSVGDIAVSNVQYRQTDSGASSSLVLTNKVVDEALQYWSDPNYDGSTADGFDNSGYLLIKSYRLGDKQGRVDVLANAGITSLQSTLYTVPLSNEAGGYSGLDPAITADLTLIAGGTFGGEVFAYEIVDAGTNSGADIANQLHYNAATNPNGVIPGGTGLTYFELGDMIVFNGANVETERGYQEGATPALVGFYVSQGGNDHPDFARFQADNGNYYTPTPTMRVLNSSTIAQSRVRINNDTKATELYNAELVTTGFDETFTFGPDGQISDGDVIHYRAAYNVGTDYRIPVDAVAVATGGDIEFLEVQVAWGAVNSWLLDGANMTEFSADGANIDVDINDPDGLTQKKRVAAWWANYITTEDGIRNFWGAYDIPSANEIIQRISVLDVLLHNVGPVPVQFTDNDVRYYREDNSLPYDPALGAQGIYMDYTGVPDTINDIKNLPTSADNADGLLNRSLAGGADGGRTVRDALRPNRNRWEIDPGTGATTIYEEDDTTVAWTSDGTLGNRLPVNGQDPD